MRAYPGMAHWTKAMFAAYQAHLARYQASDAEKRS
jgi:hypothetical protein